MAKVAVAEVHQPSAAVAAAAAAVAAMAAWRMTASAIWPTRASYGRRV